MEAQVSGSVQSRNAAMAQIRLRGAAIGCDMANNRLAASASRAGAGRFFVPARVRDAAG
jgi:hypothetical protein